MRNKGSFVLGYAVLITVIISALLCMHVYIKRAICGRWREAADVFGGGRQYEPGVTTIHEP